MVRGGCYGDGKDSFDFLRSRGSNRRSLALSGNVSRQRDCDLHVNEHTALVGHRALRFGFSVAAYLVLVLCRHRGAVTSELALGLSFAATRCRKLRRSSAAVATSREGHRKPAPGQAVLPGQPKTPQPSPAMAFTEFPRQLFGGRHFWTTEGTRWRSAR
jgi:hypothetical protein